MNISLFKSKGVINSITKLKKTQNYKSYLINISTRRQWTVWLWPTASSKSFEKSTHIVVFRTAIHGCAIEENNASGKQGIHWNIAKRNLCKNISKFKLLSTVENIIFAQLFVRLHDLSAQPLHKSRNLTWNLVNVSIFYCAKSMVISYVDYSYRYCFQRPLQILDLFEYHLPSLASIACLRQDFESVKTKEDKNILIEIQRNFKA